MTALGYTRSELLRNLRNWRFGVFVIAYPVILYLGIASTQRHSTFDGVHFPLYFMAGMATVGGISAVITSGARIAVDRAAGWTRQLRITPLAPRTYISAKLLCGFLTALSAIVLVCLASTLLGVSLSASKWLTLVGLMLVGLIPLAVLGILLGQVLSPDALTGAAGGTITALALLGGAYGFLFATSGVLFQIIKAIPSYWLVQAGRTAVHGGSWPAEGWIVVVIWTLVLIPLTAHLYRRSAARA